MGKKRKRNPRKRNKMKYKNMVDGVKVILDDGDKDTDDITELLGSFADEADNELVDFSYKILVDRGYEVKVPKGLYKPRRRNGRR